MIRNIFLACTLVALAACDGGGSDLQFAAAGKALLDQRDFNGAVIQLKNALAKNPNLTEVRFLLGKALLQKGDPRGALIELAKAQEAQLPDEQVVPEIARALLAAGEGPKLIARYAQMSLRNDAATADLKTSLARAYAAQGHVEQARTAARQALQAQPGWGLAIVELARLDAAGGNIAAALRQLDELLARDAGNASAGLLKGELLWRVANEPGAAIVAFRAVLAAQPQSIAAHAAVLGILIQQNKLAEARTQFKRLEQIAPNHPETLFLLALFDFADNEFKASRAGAERLLVAMPDNVRVLLLAGAAEYRMQHYTLAEALLGKAVKNAPDLPVARQMLAQTFMRAAEPEKAIEVLQPLVETTRADAASLALVGEAYLQAGDSKRSDAAFQRALKAAPEDARVRTSLALAQLGRGDTGRAIAQLEAIAKGDSGPQADLALVSARLRVNDLDGALLSIDALEKKLPERALPLTLRSRVLAQRGDIAGATASLEKALVKEPNHYPAVSALAAIDFNAGQPEQARKRFQDLVKADPRNFRPHLALAELDTRLGAPEAVVVTQLRQASRLNPSEPAPHLTLIERLLASGQGQDALTAAQDASAALPNDPAILEALGQAQTAAGDSQRAVSTFNKLASLQPKKALPQVRLADAYMAGKNPASAAKALRQALEIEPGNLLAQRGLALLAMADQRPKDGIAIARAMQQRIPKEAAGFALEGELEAGAKNWGAAAAAYSAALQRNKSTDLAIRLHRCLREGGNGQEAYRMAADWQRSNPKDAPFMFYLGNVAMAAKDWTQAEAQFRAVVALQPRNAAALNNIAWLLASQRKPGATALAEQANALMPERAPLLDTLALAQEADNRLPEAIKTQQRAVDLDPKDGMLRLRLARLLAKQGDKSAAREQLDFLARLGAGFSGQGEVTALLKAL